MAKFKVEDNFPSILNMALQGDVSQGEGYITQQSDLKRLPDQTYIGIYQLIEVRKLRREIVLDFVSERA